METLDELLNDLQVLAKDLGTDVPGVGGVTSTTSAAPPPSSHSHAPPPPPTVSSGKNLDTSLSSSPGSAETGDTGFDSASEFYNYSTVKRVLSPKDTPKE